jgi:hypothetical protein
MTYPKITRFEGHLIHTEKGAFTIGRVVNVRDPKQTMTEKMERAIWLNLVWMYATAAGQSGEELIALAEPRAVSDGGAYFRKAMAEDEITRKAART